MAQTSHNRFSLYETQQKWVNTPMKMQKGAQKNAPAEIEDLQDGMSDLPITEPVTFDDLLVAVGKTRNRDAFIRLFEHFAPRVKSFLMKGGMTPEEADDLAQDTMLTVWNKAPSYDSAKAAASTWIFTIARNRRIDSLRRLSSRAEINTHDPFFLEDDSEKPDDLLNRNEESKAIIAAMEELPADQADLIRKSFFEDKTHSDIADETNLPLGTVKSRIRLAMDKLRHKLKDIKS